MSILKTNTKILKSLSGEILTKSDALIDVRSTYGVTKDVSNNVSNVKLYNNPPMVFRAPSGQEPIENGNGFEFYHATDDILMRPNDNVPIQNIRIELTYEMLSLGDAFFFERRLNNNSNRILLGYYGGTMKLWYNLTAPSLNSSTYTPILNKKSKLIILISYGDSLPNNKYYVWDFTDNPDNFGAEYRDITTSSPINNEGTYTLGDLAQLKLSTSNFIIHDFKLYNNVSKIMDFQSSKKYADQFVSNV